MSNSKDENLRTILASVPSEQRIISIEHDIKNLLERVAKLEEHHQQKKSEVEKRFKIKLTLIGIVGSILSAVVTYILTKIGFL